MSRLTPRWRARSRSRRERDAASRPLELLSYVLLAGFVLVTLGPALLGAGALIDLNRLTTVQPFMALHGRTTSDTILCRWDTTDYYLPGIAAIKRAFFAGDFPTWAPYEVGGSPLASMPNHAALSPLSLPYFLLPLWFAPAFVKLGEYVVGIAGMVAFLRRLGVSRGPGILAGILFVSSGFMMMWTNWPHTRVAALIPALFWALERIVQERRARDVVLCAVVVASMLLGGFPAVTLFALTVAGAYVLVRAFTLHRGRPSVAAGVLGQAVGGVALGVGLASVQLLPFVRNLALFNLEGRESAGTHLPLGLLLTTVAPETVGLCANGDRYGKINPVEAVGFLGAAALVLAVVALVLRLPRGARPDRTPRTFFAAAAVVLVLAIWVGGPVLLAIQSLPFYSSNFIGRAQSVFGFVGAALAGFGLDRLLRWVPSGGDGPPGDGPPGDGPPGDRPPEDEPSGRPEDPTPPADDVPGKARRLVLLALAGLVAAGFAGVVVVSAYRAAGRDGYTEHLTHALVVPGVLLLAAVLAVLLTVLGRGRLRVAGPLVLAVLAVGQSTVFAHTMLPLSDPANLYPVTPTHAFLQSHLGGDRYAAPGHVMDPATSDYYELRVPNGHEFTDPRWRELLEVADHTVAHSATSSVFSSKMSKKMVHSPALDQLAVRYWVDKPDQVLGRTPPAPVGDERVQVGEGTRASCEIAGGPLRGVQLQVARSRPLPDRGSAVLHVSVRTPEGVLEGERQLFSHLPRGPQRLPVVGGEQLPAGGSYPVEVWMTGAPGALVLRGSDGRPGCVPVRPDANGAVHLVHADVGANVYERTGALPRIRWASHSEVVEDDATRLERLAAGLPDDTVLLDDASTAPASGEPADVRVLTDRPERIAVAVDASGGGYLVVADALVRDGWSATVDGEPAPLVHGNHALAAVPVPAGEHRVQLSYAAPGLRTGLLVSLTSVAVSVLLLVVPIVRRRRGRGRVAPDGGRR
ncbi:YfhO family protein [Nocardioides mesophilus]|uniref:YfhO family protein n=1 Tax=Nocardioides mesophilus TaxID=433659 RepID=A0A7G9R8C7_9ACTN|nr:YfhO family protein [Nocardioides mesophilus]QNN51852.1 YfhO family protein [Nocardioides mesophilus]